jgi:mitogen-activated protein kinase 1/3
MHRDLKPDNILMNNDGLIKICDLGLARPVCTGDNDVEYSQYVVTRWYRAPEICGCFSARYTTAIDIWAIGCIYAEMMLGRPIFPGSSTLYQMIHIIKWLGNPSDKTLSKMTNRATLAFFYSIKKNIVPRIMDDKEFAGVAEDELNLMRSMLTIDPDDRITAWDAMQLPIFKEYNNDNRPRTRNDSGAFNKSVTRQINIEFSKISSVTLTRSRLLYHMKKEAVTLRRGGQFKKISSGL